MKPKRTATAALIALSLLTAGCKSHREAVETAETATTHQTVSTTDSAHTTTTENRGIELRRTEIKFYPPDTTGTVRIEKIIRTVAGSTTEKTTDTYEKKESASSTNEKRASRQEAKRHTETRTNGKILITAIILMILTYLITNKLSKQ